MSKDGLNKLQANRNLLCNAMYQLYEVLEAGMTVELVFPEQQTIIVPNKKQKMCRLIVTKPSDHVNVALDRHPRDVKRNHLNGGTGPS